MADPAKSAVVGDTHPVDRKEYDSYAGVLLEDHPLRSYPTHYPPGLFNFLGRWYATAKRWWTERGLSLVCLFVMFLMVIQFLANLPYGISYLLAKDFTDQTGPQTQWPAEFNGRPSACISYDPHVHLDAIDRAVRAGCAGIKADLWVQDDELFVGDTSKAASNNTFNKVVIEPLMAKIDARNPAAVSPASLDRSDPGGVFDHDPTQPFMLFLQLRPSVSDAWPHLVSQLASLSQRGYLSYTDGVQVFPRPVSVVVTGMYSSDIEFVKNLGHDGINGSIFFDTALELNLIDSEKTSTVPATSHSEDDHPGHSEHTEEDLHQHLSESSLQMRSVTINFHHSIGSPRGGRFSRQQIERIRSQIRNAHQQGLQIRYDAIPCLPNPVRRIVWRILVHEGADYIEVDWTRCAGRSWRSLFTTGRRDEIR